MDHIHNETVFAFLNEYKNNPNIKRFLEEQQKFINEINNEFGTDYDSYLDYLIANIGDDSPYTMKDLIALLGKNCR